MKKFLRVTEFALAVKQPRQTVEYWVRTKKVFSMLVQQPGRPQLRIPSTEIRRVQRNLADGLPVGFDVPAEAKLQPSA